MILRQKRWPADLASYVVPRGDNNVVVSESSLSLRFPSGDNYSGFWTEKYFPGCTPEVLDANLPGPPEQALPAPATKPLCDALQTVLVNLFAVDNSLKILGTSVENAMNIYGSLSEMGQTLADTLPLKQIVTEVVEFIGRFDIHNAWSNVNRVWSNFSKSIQAMTFGIQAWMPVVLPDGVP